MTAPITAITATIPGREEMLSTCLQSVQCQTEPIEGRHLVCSEPPVEGMPGPVHCALMQNQLLGAVKTPWVMRLADDDYLLSTHVETLWPHTDEADIVYSWGRGHGGVRWDCTDWDYDKLVDTFADHNLMDGSAVLYRMSMVMAVGGWPSEMEDNHFVGMKAAYEDWGLFYSLALQGARFKCVPQETWVYGNGNWPRISNGH